ncbi:4Fe-4S cluster-binding domain-containing protein [Olsenella porci]|uniref:Radical SAM protein n=1 Tax=Olsenella porci TaxID=2652279 RepID=A0A6N7X9A0_9ACTN|nr:4Fe-4S cluster-binding domain-containing protein [Olsenella porci]MST71997.1 radical SAM protein [Olsenella porci]
MTSSTAPNTCCSPNGALYTNIQRFSIHDGGGIRTVVFLKGCPFRCPWCCNPENLSFAPQTVWHAPKCIHCSMAQDVCGADACPRRPEDCPTGAKELLGTVADPGELLGVVMRDRVFYEESNGGVTVSGGECLARQNLSFTLEFLAACRKEGLDTAVETTLAVPIDRPELLAAVTSTFLVDFKIADRGQSLRVTGIDPSLRDKNLERLLSMGARVVARMPVIPGFTADAANVRANIDYMRDLGISRVDVLPFHQMGEAKYDSIGMRYELRGRPQLGEGDVRDVVSACEGAGLRVVVHGE